MKHVLPLILSILALSTAPILAGGKAQVCFLAETLPAGVDEITWIAGKNQGEAFKLSVSQLTPAVSVPVRLFGLQTHPDKRQLAKVTLPETGDSFTVLLVPEPDGSLKPVIVDTHARAFRAGDLFFYNHSDQTIFGSLGDTAFELAPGEGKPLRPGGDMAEGSYNVSFNVRDGEGERVLRTMRWPVQTRSRVYGFFFKNPAKNRIEFRAVDEYVEAGKKGSGKP